MELIEHTIDARVRKAGKRYLHTVAVDGKVVATRRSEHRYAYVMCRWQSIRHQQLGVTRWSDSPKTRGGEFPQHVYYAEGAE